MQETQASAPEIQFVLMPNGSLSTRGAWIFMALATFATMGCAGICTWFGFWPVLPFAGLELGALAWALSVSMQRSRFREVIRVGQDGVSVESGMSGRGASSRIEWPRTWTRASLEADAEGRPDRVLVIARGGQRVILGQFLTDEERKAVVRRLQCALHSGPPHTIGQSARQSAAEILGDG